MCFYLVATVVVGRRQNNYSRLLGVLVCHQIYWPLASGMVSLRKLCQWAATPKKLSLICFSLTTVIGDEGNHATVVEIASMQVVI